MDTLEKIKAGFASLKVDDSYKQKALAFISDWLTKPEFAEYVPQIEYLAESQKFDELLDSFYQIIPFGTGGRRGLVGIGPNRINTWTIQASAQGHSQYLIKKFGDDAKSRGIVITYDVRKYLKEGIYDNSRPNPVWQLSCKDLAESAAKVYAANGVKVYLFTTFSSTPELSFAVRNVHAVGGDMISASHNPPEFNGKKVVDETGGQLLPPGDQELVDVVVNEVSEIKVADFDESVKNGLIHYFSGSDHEAYLQAASSVSLNKGYRSAKILFSPFHGTSSESVFPVLKRLGFDITMDDESGKEDAAFSSITFNIPNPEVEEAYQNLINPADSIGADIILTTDPDGDRIGLMTKESDGWHFFNGNEIMAIVVGYMLSELKNENKLQSSNVIIKTLVTSNLITAIANKYDVQVIGDLLVGIKYIAYEMNKLEKDGRIQDFLIGGEESHGMVSGNYIRDKDSCVAAILLSEAASMCKDRGVTLSDYLKEIYSNFGYYRNYLTEIRLPGAEGMTNMAKIQSTLRSTKPTSFGTFEIASMRDMWDGEPFLSETDKVSRNMLVFKLKPKDDATVHIQVTIRPSGTEPKTKMYVEIGRKPVSKDSINDDMTQADKVREEVEKAVIIDLYKILGIDFPERGFLLFWQLSATDKLKYFEIEPSIEALVDVADAGERKNKLDVILKFLGSDPVQKVDKAFTEKNKKGIMAYLNLE
ncbi:MAG: phospho-sugar mutase [Microgenomates group bacterium]